MIQKLLNKQATTHNTSQKTVWTLKYWVWHASRLNIKTLLFLIYISNLSKMIIFLSVHYFLDDTIILYVSSSLKYINKKINHDLFNLVQWLRTNNKTCLMSAKRK